jgi:6-phosphogluconolactonase (cycloisomerase 2 family)
MRGSLKVVVAALVLTAAISLPASAMAAKKAAKKPVGVVYTETNSPKRNQVQIFHRFANGSLKFVTAVATGGRGGQQLQPGCAPTCPFLDTQGEVTLSSNGKLLFVVNAGSDSITSFKVKPGGGLQKADVKPSGGKFPNSITTHGNVLYVLDSGIFPMPGPPVPGNVQGFHFNAAGHLTPIKGSNRPLTPTVPGLARQVGFNNSGTVLVATLLGDPTLATPTASNSIDTFQIHGNGSASPATAHNATTPFPFGFAFDPKGHLIMSQVTSLTVPGAGDTASYKVSAAGALTPINTVASKGTAPCWVEITSNGKYAFVVNTGGGAPTGAFTTSYGIAPNGALKFLANTPVRKGEFALTDEALSRDSKYLYVLAAAPPPTLAHHIDEYKVLGNGHLKFIGRTPDMAVPGTSGMAGL